MYNPIGKDMFLSRMADRIKGRVGGVKDAWSRIDTQHPLETSLQTVGQGAGLVSDTLGEAMRSGYRTLPSAVRQPLDQAGQNIMKSPIGDFAAFLARKAGDFSTAHPRAAADISAVGNIASLYPIAKGVTGFTGAVENAGEAFSQMAERNSAKNAIASFMEHPTDKGRFIPIFKNPTAYGTLRNTAKFAKKIYGKSGRLDL